MYIPYSQLYSNAKRNVRDFKCKVNGESRNTKIKLKKIKRTRKALKNGRVHKSFLFIFLFFFSSFVIVVSLL